jgi:regulator of ribosome biosynthesis
MLFPLQVPKERAKTRWEEFRLQKGIDHKKRERMLWDEKTGKYRPRWGKDRASNEEEWAVPAKASDGMPAPS